MTPSLDSPPAPERVLLGQLNSYGDCLLATTVARQIKHDFPGSHLTWAIGSPYRSVLQGNPHVDEVWEWPISGPGQVADTWKAFETAAVESLRSGKYDRAYLTQVSPANLHHYDGTIRHAIFRAYPFPITVPVAPVIRLTEAELARVQHFAESHHLHEFQHVILFEAEPQSGQSPLDLKMAKSCASTLVREMGNAVALISSAKPVESGHDRIIDASELTFRENAELCRYCTLLVGGSSGISWLSTSEWTGKIATVQLADSGAIWSNPMSIDFGKSGLDSSLLIEIADGTEEQLQNCVSDIISMGFEDAKARHHRPVESNYEGYPVIMSELLRHLRFSDFRQFARVNFKRPDFSWPGFIRANLRGAYRTIRNLAGPA